MFKKLFAAVALVIVSLAPFSVSNSVKAQTVPPVSTIYSSISVTLDNISRQELYAFMTDMTNEPLWYPGILETTLIKEGRNGGPVGRQYRQVAYVTPELTTTTNIEVLRAIPNLFYQIKGDGDLADYDAIYTFTPANRGKGSVYTLTSKYLAPGFTKETFTQYITYALGQLVTYFSDRSTGSVHANFVYVIE